MWSTTIWVISIHVSEIMGKYAFEPLFIKCKKIEIMNDYGMLFEDYLRKFKENLLKLN